MKIFSKISVALLTCLLIASSGYAKTLRLGMTPEPFMPFTQINQAGEWEGFEADITNALCEKMGGACDISQMAWEGLIPSLTSGKVDFIVGAFSVTDKRREVVDFSTPYYYAAAVFVGMKSDKAVISNTADAAGSGMVVDPKGFSRKVVGVQNASIQAAYMEKYMGQVEMKSYPAADNALADLTAGRIDYVFLDEEYAQSFLDTKEGQDYEVKHEAPRNVVLGEGIAYAVSKGDTETRESIDAALGAMQADGSLDAMIQKWFNKK